MILIEQIASEKCNQISLENRNVTTADRLEPDPKHTLCL